MKCFKDLFKKNKLKNDYEIFFDNNQDPLCITSIDGYFIKLNNKLIEKLGYSEKELYSKKFLDFIHKDDLQDTIDNVSEISNGTKTYGNCTNRYISSKNECIRFKWSYWKKSDKLYCIAKDITEEYELQYQINEYKDILNESEILALIGCWKLNINTNSLIWTDGLKKIYNTKDVSLKNYIDITHPDDRESVKSSLDKCIQTKEDYTLTHRFIINDKIRYLYVKGKYTIINNESYIIGIVQDITLQKNTEFDLIDSKNKAEFASKMKTDFVTNISHEIRTPINGIIGMTNLLTDMELLPEEKECIEIISHSSGVLLSIINNVLDFSKIEAGKMTLEYTDVIIKDFLEKKRLIFGQRIREKNLSLNIYINNNVPDIIYTDSLKIKQILTNLINNSIKFTYYGSISIIVTKVNNNIEFSVKDTGIGISTDTQSNLFNPFIQADNSTTRTFGGTGLGLSICKSLINLLKGTITMKSSEGIGTTVTFTIPLLEKDLKQNELKDNQEEFEKNQLKQNKFKQNELNLLRQNEQNDLIKKHDKLIIIIEDNKTNQIVTKKTLEKLSFNNYKIYENGDKFLNDICNLGKIDLILMDLHMPVMDGYTCTTKIRELKYTMPIIASTANAMSGEKKKCINIGMNDFILKPIQLLEFKNVINKWLNI